MNKDWMDLVGLTILGITPVIFIFFIFYFDRYELIHVNNELMVMKVNPKVLGFYHGSRADRSGPQGDLSGFL